MQYSLPMVTMAHFISSVLNYWTDIVILKRGTRTSKFNTAEKNAALKTVRIKMRKSEREKWSRANSTTVKSAAQ